MVFSADHKILALCDISSKTSILEIKTYNPYRNEILMESVAQQLYYESENRNNYILTMEFEFPESSKKEFVNSLTIRIYQVFIEASFNENKFVINERELKFFYILKKHPGATIEELMDLTKMSKFEIRLYLKDLKKKGFINYPSIGGKKVYKILKDIEVEEEISKGQYKIFERS